MLFLFPEESFLISNFSESVRLTLLISLMQERQVFSILPLVQPTPDGSPIDKAKVAEVCSYSLSECPPEDRAVAWLVLLDVFPEKAEKWNEEKEKILQLYSIFLEEYKMTDWIEKIFPPNVKKTVFNLADNAIMAVIHGDVERSGRHFFFLPPDEIPPGANPNDIQSPFIFHIRRIERILYIFSQTNPLFAYMQGFNELVIPLYYVLIQAKTMFGDDYLLIEALTYRMLQNLLTNTDIQEFYATKDQSTTIMTKLSSFEKLLKLYLPDTYQLLEKLNVYPLLYAYRWFNILFSQEHDLPVLLILWDSLFSKIDHLIEFSFYLGVAHVKAVAPLLDPESFPKSVEVLQHLKIRNPCDVIKEAKQMWNNRFHYKSPKKK